MKLKDLLVSYNQVLTPKYTETPIQEEVNPLDRIRSVVTRNNNGEEISVPEEDVTTFSGWKYTPEIPSKATSDSKVTSKHTREYRASLQGQNYKNWKAALNDYITKSGDFMSELKKKDLEKIAFLESRYDLRALNKDSSASGWFLFIRSTRSGLGYNGDDFLDNAYDQFAAASKLYDDNERDINKYKDLLSKKGISDFLARYGWWWHPGEMKRYLSNGADDGTDASGNTLRQILTKAASV